MAVEWLFNVVEGARPWERPPLSTPPDRLL